MTSTDKPLLAPQGIVVMGVSGCGKSTVAKALAEHLAMHYLDADDFHPSANVEKMRAGIALTDEDRWPWLATLNNALISASKTQPAVLACSALKQAYRARLAQGIPQLRVVHLVGSEALIAARMAQRQHKYMPPSLLKSQIATLEAPVGAIEVPIDQPVDTIVRTVADALRNSA